MGEIKAEAENRDMFIERAKGTFTEEGKEYTSNYSLICNSSFINIKKLPQSAIEKEKLVFDIYGNNIGIDQMRELMKLCRTQVIFCGIAFD